MLERHFTPILRGVGEHFHKDFLRQVFFIEPARQVRADDFDDDRIEMLDERARGVLVADPHAGQTLRDIQAGRLTHKSSKHPTSTGKVTARTIAGYTGG